MLTEEESNIGLTTLTDFLADIGTPSSDHMHKENQQAESQATSPPKEQTNTERIIRRRERKACVECHKR